MLSASLAWQRLAAEHDLALAEQGRAQMGERREVARGADRALARDHRQRARLDQSEDALDDDRGARRYGRGRGRSP